MTPRVIFATISLGIGFLVYAGMEPILVLRVKEQGMSTYQTGIILSIPCSIYIVGTLLAPLIPDRVQKRFIMMSSLLGMGLFLFMVGPS